MPETNPYTDATAEFFSAMNDPTRWIVKASVPVFKQHQRTDPATGKLISVDLPKLYRIAANMQRLERMGGVPVRMTLGHTEPGQPETQQPPIGGYYRNARVQPFGPRGEPAVVVDEWLDPTYAPARKNFPYRSAEYYDDTEQITGVALLTRDPYLDLGVVAYGGFSSPLPGPTMYAADGRPRPAYLFTMGDYDMWPDLPRTGTVYPPAPAVAVLPIQYATPAPAPAAYSQHNSGFAGYPTVPTPAPAPAPQYQPQHFAGANGGPAQYFVPPAAVPYAGQPYGGGYYATDWPQAPGGTDDRMRMQHPSTGAIYATPPGMPGAPPPMGAPPMPPGMPGMPPAAAHPHPPIGVCSPGMPPPGMPGMPPPGPNPNAIGLPAHPVPNADDGDPMYAMYNHLCGAVSQLSRELATRNSRRAAAPYSDIPTGMPSDAPFPQGSTHMQPRPPQPPAPTMGTADVPYGRPAAYPYAAPAAPVPYGYPQPAPADVPRTISGLPVGYQMQLDQMQYELSEMKRVNQVLLYERDQNDSAACAAEIGKLAAYGYQVGEYEVAELKSKPGPDARAGYLQHIMARYQRVGTEMVPPLLGDPSPASAPAGQGPATKQEMDAALSYVAQAERQGQKLDYIQALAYARGAGSAPTAYGPPQPQAMPGQYGWEPGAAMPPAGPGGPGNGFGDPYAAHEPYAMNGTH